MPSNLTPPRVPMVDVKTGTVSREWFNFFLTIANLTNSGSNSFSLNDLQQMPPIVPVSGWTPPIGMIVFFADITTPPAGWVEYTPLRGRFPRGMVDPSTGTPGATGGSTTVTTGYESSDNVYDLQTGTNFTPTVPVANHTHTASNYWQPYVDGLWCKYTG